MFWNRGDRDMRTVWGYTFEWTSEHLTQEHMRPLTYTYDALAAECLDRLDELSPPSSRQSPSGSKTAKTERPIVPEPPSAEETNDEDHENSNNSNNNHPRHDQRPSSHGGGVGGRRDLYVLLAHHHASDPTLSALWTQLHTVPDWVDWSQIKRGQDVFYRYGGPAIVSLTFQSLVGGMAGWRVVETLSRTGGFDARVAKRRLLETFQHILQVTQSPESLQCTESSRGEEGEGDKGDGEGLKSSVRVRLLHASVRRRILLLARDCPEYFDVDEWGVPINDLDSIGTILSFSAALIWVGLPRQGIFLREQEIVDYTALWRYVAYLLGTPTTPWLADHRQSKILFESLVVAELKPSAMSQVLANNIITGLSDQPPTNASREFLCAEAWWLNGGDLSRELGIERPRLWYRVLVAGQCLYFMAVCYLYRMIPSWDEAKNERVRTFFYNMAIHHKTIGLGQETVFDFKYLPQLGRMTSPGSGVGGSKDSKRAVSRRRAVVPLRGSSERNGLHALILASALVGTVAWFGLRSALGSGYPNVGSLRW